MRAQDGRTAKAFLKRVRCGTCYAQLGTYRAVFLDGFTVRVVPERLPKSMSRWGGSQNWKPAGPFFGSRETGLETRRLPNDYNLRDGLVYLWRCDEGHESWHRGDELLDLWQRDDCQEYVG